MKLMQEKTHDQQNTKILNKTGSVLMIFLSPQVPVWLCDSPHMGPLIASFTPKWPSCSPKRTVHSTMGTSQTNTKQKQVTNACLGLSLSHTKGQTIFRKSSIYGKTKTMMWTHDYKIRIVVTWGQVHRTLDSTEVTTTELKNEVFSC